jgi:hypothetical protein
MHQMIKKHFKLQRLLLSLLKIKTTSKSMKSKIFYHWWSSRCLQVAMKRNYFDTTIYLIQEHFSLDAKRLASKN